MRFKETQRMGDYIYTLYFESCDWRVDIMLCGGLACAATADKNSADGWLAMCFSRAIVTVV